jgi:transcriptional regulator with XRE-family HTH domain
MKLFDKIRILRRARGLSQEQLGYSLSRANKDGISRQTVSDWENGKFEPKLENIRDLAEVFDVSFDALLDESIDLNDDKVLYAVINKDPLDEYKQVEKKEEPEEMMVEPVAEVKAKEKQPIPFKEIFLLMISAVAIYLFISNFMTTIYQLIEIPGFAAGEIPFIIGFASLVALGVVAVVLFVRAIARKKIPMATMLIFLITIGLLATYATYINVNNLVMIVTRHDENTTYIMEHTIVSFESFITIAILRLVWSFTLFSVLIIGIIVIMNLYLKPLNKERQQAKAKLATNK